MRERLDSITGWTGQHVLRSAFYIIDLIVFMQQSIRDWLKSRNLLSHVNNRSLLRQIIFSGIDALPLVTLLAFAVGVMFTGQMIHLTGAFTSQANIIGILSFLITYEIGPLLTAIILIGRSASAMVVDIGNMKQQGEIEALELLGINISDYLVAPRLIGAAFSQLVLAVYFCGIALYGGIFFASSVYSHSYMLYFDQAFYSLGPVLIYLFILKNIVFGLIIAGTACFHALQINRSSIEVPQQTQRAIVNSLAIIFIFDGLLAIAGQSLGTGA